MVLQVKVISVFAGLGKTYVGNKYANVCDLQSSPYRYDYTNISEADYEKMKYDSNMSIHPKWPQNYIQALKEAMIKYDLILVPSNEDIRGILQENHIEFLFVLPSVDSRKILEERYRNRGNNAILIDSVLSYFDSWSRDQKDYSYPICILEKDKYLEDLLKELKLLKEE